MRRYTSEGGLLSIQNYNDEQKIQTCIDKGCDYEVASVIEIDTTSNTRTLTLQILHFGDKSTI